MDKMKCKYCGKKIRKVYMRIEGFRDTRFFSYRDEYGNPECPKNTVDMQPRHSPEK